MSNWKALRRQFLELTVDKTEASGLGSDQATSPVATLAGKDAFPPVPLCSVGAEHVSDLTRGNTNVTGRNVGVSTNVLVKLAHEGNAELADLVVRLALGVEVGTTLATAHADY